jgi:predicted secreted protein
MTYFSAFAVFFIIWWVTLFAVLPFGLRTQAEEGEHVPGTEPSAPKGPHVLRAMLRTTVVSVLIFGALYVLVKVYGFNFEDIPQIVPDFR